MNKAIKFMAAKKGKKKDKRISRKPMKPITSSVRKMGYIPPPKATVYKGHKGIIKVVQMDTSVSSSVDSRARKQMRNNFNKLKGRTHFEDFEVERLLHLYWKLRRNRKFSEKEFRLFLFNAFGLCNRYMIKLMFNCLGFKGEISAQEFVKLMSIFCRGTLQEKTALAFKVYDTSKTGTIHEDHILHLIQRTFINQGVFEHKVLFQAREYQQYVLNEFDPKELKRITFDDYKEAVTAKPGLLEGFGQIYPDRLAVYTFLTTFTPLVTTEHEKFEIEYIEEEIVEEATEATVKPIIYWPLRTLRSFTKVHLDDLYAELYEDEIATENEEEDEESSEEVAAAATAKEEDKLDELARKSQKKKMTLDRASLRKSALV